MTTTAGGLLGTICLAAGVFGYFVYTDIKRPSIPAPNKGYDFYQGGKNTDKYANSLLQFYMNSGFTIEESGILATSFVYTIMEESKIDDEDTLKSYFYCSIQKKTADTLVESRQILSKFSGAVAYLREHKEEKATFKFRKEFEWTTGLGYSAVMLALSHGRLPGFLIFKQCWKEAEAGDLTKNLPYGVTLP